MTCDLCKSRKPGGGEYDMKRLCCAARIVDMQIERVCAQYGHARSDLVKAMRDIPRGKA